MKRISRVVVFLFVLSLVSALPAAEGKATVPEKAAPSKPAQEMTHWITIKSGIRPNSKCRYYHNSKGKPCTKDEGRGCKICGG